MQVSDQEIRDLKNLITNLNERKGVVIVEGKRDAKALKKLGYRGRILEFHKFGGLVRFTDCAAEFDEIIMMLDADRKGRYLTSRILRLLERRTRINITVKHKLMVITKGRIRFIEDLVIYESAFA